MPQTLVVSNDSRSQYFAFPVSATPTAVQLDPQQWILRGTTTTGTLVVGDLDNQNDVDAEDFTLFSGCYTGSNGQATSQCANADFDGDGDVDCTDWSEFQEAWTAGGEAPDFATCTALAAPQVFTEGSRYLSVTPIAGTEPIALRVSSPELACLSAYIDFDANPALAMQHVGRLVEASVFRTPTEWGTVYLADADIIPETTYQIQSDFGGGVTSFVAAMPTGQWGDVVAPFGVVDFRDVGGTIDGFKELPTAPPVTRTDLDPQRPDFVVNFADIGATLDAFRGVVFPYVPPSSCN